MPEETRVAGELQRRLLILRDIGLFLLGEPVQEYVAIADSRRQDGPVSAAPTASGTSHTFLVEER